MQMYIEHFFWRVTTSWTYSILAYSKKTSTGPESWLGISAFLANLYPVNCKFATHYDMYSATRLYWVDRILPQICTASAWSGGTAWAAPPIRQDGNKSRKLYAVPNKQTKPHETCAYADAVQICGNIWSVYIEQLLIKHDVFRPSTKIKLPF